LVDPVDDDEDLVPQTSDFQLTMRDLKKRKELFTHLDRLIITFILLYIGLAIELIISDHRLPSFCQLDLQEASKLTLKFQVFECQENIFRS
jgi:hypothetical protein